MGRWRWRGDDADTGGAWRYFNRYCESAGKQPADLRMHVLKRTIDRADSRYDRRARSRIVGRVNFGLHGSGLLHKRQRLAR